LNPPTRQLLFVCMLAGVAALARPARAADPTTAQCLAASESSLTLRNQHKLRDARAQLLICSAASCPADVRNECTRRVPDINAALPTIVFAAQDAAGNDLVGVKVTADGQVIAERLDGSALAIDPGAHSFTFDTAGQTKIEKQFVIREGEKDRRERIVFGAPSVATAPAPAGAPAPAATPAPVLVAFPPPATTSGGLGTQRVLAIVTAGVGAVGLGVGIAYGLKSQSKHEDAIKICPMQQCPDQTGVDLWNQAVSAGDYATIGFIVGGVALAGAATLWFTAPQPSGEKPTTQPTTQFALGPGTLQLKGVW
jgi:hypothetical protein